MADRTVTVRLSMDASGYVTVLDQAAKKTDDAAKKADKLAASATKVGDGMQKMGLVAAAGVTLVGKAAMDWESAWTGVTKTVDGSAEQMAELEGQLRNLAKTLPASHDQIAAVAEAAGQLGIKREDVAAFTKTMIDLGETTNLTADEAATSLAQFSNIMGTSAKDVDRLGATIVALGNDGASTEKDIVEMGLRIAGAGKTIGLTETQVLAYASALSSVGVAAEAGGTAISQFMLKTDSMVREGGDGLQELARISGMTMDDFQKAWQDDAGAALDTFIQGLGKAQAAGEDTSEILKILGVDGIREADALRRLASSGDLLADSLNTGSTAWEQNIALIQEAEKRYGTTESKVRVAWNNIKDAAIEAGEVVLPVIAQVSGAVAELAKWFGQLPPGAQKMMVGAAIIVAAVGLIGGSVLRLMPQLVAMKTALGDVGSSKAASGLRRVAGAASALGLALAAGAAAGAAISASGFMQGKAADAAEYANALTGLAKGGDDAAESLNRLLDAGVEGESGTQVLDLASAFKQLKENMNPVNDAISFLGDNLGGLSSSQRQVQKQFASMDQALRSMDAGAAARAFAEISKSAADAGVSNEQLLSTFPEYKARLTEVATQIGVTNLSAQEYVDWMGGKVPDAVLKATESNSEAASAVARVSSNVRDAAKELQDYMNKMDEMADKALASSNAEIAWRETLAGVAAQLKENGKGFDLNTEKGRANQKFLNGMVSDGRSYIQSLEDQGIAGKELTKAQNDVAAQIIKTATSMGMSRDEAIELTKKMNLIPDEVSTKIAAPGSKATKKQAEEINKAIRDIPPEKQAKIKSAWMRGGYDAAKKALANLKDKTVSVNIQPRYLTPTGRPPAMGGPKIFLPYADGGVLPGYTPGRDVHRFWSPTAGGLDLSGGEGIMRPEWVRQVGGPAAVDRMNAAAKVGRRAFADGGVFEPTRYTAASYSGSGSAVSVSLDGAVLTGKLDLGGGLEGRIEAVVSRSMTRVGDQVERASRQNARSRMGGA